ncbi:extracellular solute-binding protein [Streptomyces sp. A7024]|uniref:Extracellular solute-binding protein n=1 Tax=Streptomyces coryli TaxID=1128680 RepID=A0A6G4U6Y3_9ACTN|nr:extracellular solute-binding protein [Streptomyces coryli]NGN67148.1 extracellular solute-binding protein [Streptomyces coryli]
MRRLVVLAAVAALLAGACAAPRAGTAADPVELRIATGSDLTSGGIRRKLIEAWDDRHENVTVKIVELAEDADRQRSQLAAALQAGNKDGYDIVNLDVTWTAEFAEQELIAPLDATLTRSLKGLRPQIRQTVRYEDKSWAVPWNTDVGLLYYRADLLGRDFAPDDYGDLTAAVARFRTQRDQQVTAGLITQLSPYEGLTVNAHEAVWRHKGTIVDGDGEVRVAEPAARAGLDELAASFKPAGPYDPGNPPLPLLSADSLGATETTSVERFLAGETLAMRNWPFALDRLADAENKRGDGPRAEYGVTTLPGPAALGGQNLALTTGAPQEARQLVADLTGTAAGRCLRAGGFVPAREEALTGDCAARLVKGGRPEQADVPDRLRGEYDAALDDALDAAKARPVTPYYAAVTRDIQEAVHEQLAARQRGRAVPEGADVESLADRLDQALKGQ